METDPYLRSDHGHGHGYGHDHLPFPSPTHDDDDACMDALLFLVDDDMFMSPEEVQPPSSCDQVVIKERNQQESLNPQELSLTDLLLMCAQVKDFLNKARKLSPKLVVVVEEELFSSRRASAMAPPPPPPPPSSFVEFFCDALHHFSSVSDSLGCSFYGGYRVGLRFVEEEMLGPRIIDCVGCFPFGPLTMDGFRLAPLSSYWACLIWGLGCRVRMGGWLCVGNQGL